VVAMEATGVDTMAGEATMADTGAGEVMTRTTTAMEAGEAMTRATTAMEVVSSRAVTARHRREAVAVEATGPTENKMEILWSHRREVQIIVGKQIEQSLLNRFFKICLIHVIFLF